MTLEKLAQMVQAGFDSLKTELQNEMHTGFAEINRKIDKMIEPRLDNHAQRIKKLEEEVFPG